MVDARLTRSPDGQHVICCICIEWTHYDDLADTPDGGKWDMCKSCGATEALAAAFRWMSRIHT